MANYSNETTESFANKLYELTSTAHGEDYCGTEDADEDLVNSVTYWVSGVSVTAVGSLGVVWNILSLVTISTIPKKSLFHKLLITLTTFDTLFLMSGGIFMVQQSLKFESTLFNTLFPKIIYPLAGITMTGSSFTCVAIALERYLGICQSHSEWYIRKSRFYIIAILILVTLVDGPRFLEIDPLMDEKNITVIGFTYSDLRTDRTYITAYTLWFRLFATAVVPFCIMLFCNAAIIFYYRKNRFNSAARGSDAGQNIPSVAPNVRNVLEHQTEPQPRRVRPTLSCLTPSGTLARASIDAIRKRSSVSVSGISGISVNSRASPLIINGGGQRINVNGAMSPRQSRNLYITFCFLTVTFLLCHLPRIILNVYEVPMSQRRVLCNQLFGKNYFSPTWVHVFASVEKLLLIVNSSINFVFYCLAGKSFRQQMSKLFQFVYKVISLSIRCQLTLKDFRELQSPFRARDYRSRHNSCFNRSTLGNQFSVSRKHSYNVIMTDANRLMHTGPMRGNLSLQPSLIRHKPKFWVTSDDDDVLGMSSSGNCRYARRKSCPETMPVQYSKTGNTSKLIFKRNMSKTKSLTSLSEDDEDRYYRRDCYLNPPHLVPHRPLVDQLSVIMSQDYEPSKASVCIENESLADSTDVNKITIVDTTVIVVDCHHNIDSGDFV